MLPRRRDERDERDDWLIPRDFFERELEEFFRPFFQSYDIISRGVMDVYETDEDFIIECDLPGLDKKDIRIDLKDDLLRISAEKKASEETKKGRFYRQERYYGRIERAVRLPDYVNKDKIQAKYEDGVLKISIPKKESAKAEVKKIPIE
ncbi:MAG TPA: Hsp20/alpha crystallin family protein [Defluviitoga sp.]|nr:Hsp20/alpha crystallin family protein [Defluviitoga sp.]HOP24090.1 Hsp20/alpha crystallin family protein [Defluviitoga sp.]HPZ28576.1 Hsp20/alpha crystallin family protein [Defluviitoga sp.]HQD62386.1 Hsp20/alpha crystallin family protein [Defluviitoga sp.]